MIDSLLNKAGQIACPKCIIHLEPTWYIVRPNVIICWHCETEYAIPPEPNYFPMYLEQE